MKILACLVVILVFLAAACAVAFVVMAWLEANEERLSRLFYKLVEKFSKEE